MKNKGIDQFRVIAAMMVVAIHCLPLHYFMARRRYPNHIDDFFE